MSCSRCDGRRSISRPARWPWRPARRRTRTGGSFPFTPELRAVLEAQREATERLQREREAIIPWVFHRRGKPTKDLHKVWRKACAAAGCPGRIPHDFRRTAVRNLERAGVSRSVAMKLVGHKTESVYRRYAIVSQADLSAAAGKLAQLEGEASGTSFGTSRPIRAASPDRA